MRWILLLCLFLVGCATNKTPTKAPPQQQVKPEPVKPQPSNGFAGKWNNSEWDSFLDGAIRSSYLDKVPVNDFKDFHFKKSIGTKTEWAKLFIEMAKWESGYKPEKFYLEKTCKGVGIFRKCSTIRDRKGRIVTSRGLFQLSIESSNLNYKCGFKDEKEVHDPEKNIRCAVKIMERWVLQDKVIGKVSPNRGGARYWSVLRGTREYTKKALAAIKLANKYK